MLRLSCPMARSSNETPTVWYGRHTAGVRAAVKPTGPLPSADLPLAPLERVTSNLAPRHGSPNVSLGGLLGVSPLSFSWKDDCGPGDASRRSVTVVGVDERTEACHAPTTLVVAPAAPALPIAPGAPKSRWTACPLAHFPMWTFAP